MHWLHDMIDGIQARMATTTPSSGRGFIRETLHNFLGALCGAFFGITPPPENREVPFLFGLIGAFVFIVGTVLAIAYFLIGMIAGR